MVRLVTIEDVPEEDAPIIYEMDEPDTLVYVEEARGRCTPRLVEEMLSKIPIPTLEELESPPEIEIDDYTDEEGVHVTSVYVKRGETLERILGIFIVDRGGVCRVYVKMDTVGWEGGSEIPSLVGAALRAIRVARRAKRALCEVRKLLVEGNPGYVISLDVRTSTGSIAVEASIGATSASIVVKGVEENGERRSVIVPVDNCGGAGVTLAVRGVTSPSTIEKYAGILERMVGSDTREVEKTCITLRGIVKPVIDALRRTIVPFYVSPAMFSMKRDGCEMTAEKTLDDREIFTYVCKDGAAALKLRFTYGIAGSVDIEMDVRVSGEEMPTLADMVEAVVRHLRRFVGDVLEASYANSLLHV